VRDGVTPLCEHPFVTSQGHPCAEFQRAVERGNLLQAKALAKVVAQSAGKLSLGDALALLTLMAAKHDIAYAREALRWLARFVSEVPAVSLEEAQLALAALATMDRLEKDGTAQEALKALCRRGGAPAKGLSRLDEGEPCGVGFLEGDQSAGELEQGEVVLVFLRPADQDRAVSVEP
jgi:hypothetical protein